MPQAPVVEIFNSYQGEGIYLGAPMTFIRFAGCNLTCDYCDTKPARNSDKYPRRFPAELLKRIKDFSGPEIISFTGGEPLLYPGFLLEIFPEIKKLKKKIYLETNASLPENFRKVKKWVDIVAMDIKLPSATGRVFFKSTENFLHLAADKKVFVKIVLTQKTKFAEIKRSVKIITSVSPEIPLCFTPVAGRKKIFNNWERINQFVGYAKKFLPDVRVIPQIHKFLFCR